VRKGWQKYEINRVEIVDKQYPDILREIEKPPEVLYYRGEIGDQMFEKSLGVVGSRRMTRYGRETTERIVGGIASTGVTVVSGFMYGVDTAAHWSAIENGGVTAAVFGGGLNEYYPPENDELYTEILESGGIVFSEYEAETKPKLWTFVQRNRIVAGLSSLGVLVVEAGEGSGSLITAKYAKKFGRELFAVPGPINSSSSRGTNELIKNGEAKMVADTLDVIGGKMMGGKNSQPNVLSDKEKRIWKELEREPLSLDELSVILGENISTVSVLITGMSLKGYLLEVGGIYQLT